MSYILREENNFVYYAREKKFFPRFRYEKDIDLATVFETREEAEKYAFKRSSTNQIVVLEKPEKRKCFLVDNHCIKEVVCIDETNTLYLLKDEKENILMENSKDSNTLFEKKEDAVSLVLAEAKQEKEKLKAAIRTQEKIIAKWEKFLKPKKFRVIKKKKGVSVTSEKVEAEKSSKPLEPKKTVKKVSVPSAEPIKEEKTTSKTEVETVKKSAITKKKTEGKSSAKTQKAPEKLVQAKTSKSKKAKAPVKKVQAPKKVKTTEKKKK